MNLRKTFFICFFAILSIPSIVFSNSLRCEDFINQEVIQTPKSFWQRLISPFVTAPVSVSDVHFVGEPLSEAQFQNLLNFSNGNRKPIKKDDIIMTMSMKEAEEALLENRIPQQVFKNDEFENGLLMWSKVNSDIREVFNFRLHYEDGSIFVTRFFKIGDTNNLDIASSLSQLYEELDGDLSGITGIEIAHTHPFYAVRVISGKTARVRMNELSREDMRVARSLAQRMPRGKFVLIKAILPNGFYYQAQVPSGF